MFHPMRFRVPHDIPLLIQDYLSYGNQGVSTTAFCSNGALKCVTDIA